MEEWSPRTTNRLQLPVQLMVDQLMMAPITAIWLTMYSDQSRISTLPATPYAAPGLEYVRMRSISITSTAIARLATAVLPCRVAPAGQHPVPLRTTRR